MKIRRLMAALVIGVTLLAPPTVHACDPDTQNCGSEWSDEEWNRYFWEPPTYETGPGPHEDQPIAN